jgi:hypothetical protein
MLINHFKIKINNPKISDRLLINKSDSNNLITRLNHINNSNNKPKPKSKPNRYNKKVIKINNNNNNKLNNFMDKIVVKNNLKF